MVKKKKQDMVEKYEERKMDSITFYDYYKEVHPERAERLRNCSDRIAKETYGSEKTRLVAYHCYVRMCPICIWKRSRKIFAQITKVIEAIQREKPCYYVFLTLTQKNVEADELNGEMTRIMEGFNRLTKNTAYQRSVLGYFRSVEITHNVTENTFHPHIHALLAVPKQYYNAKYDLYINQKQWTSIWQQSLQINYTPVVHVQMVKGTNAKAIAEVSKYAVKSAELIQPDDWQMSVDTIRTVEAAMNNRRLASFGGIMKQYHKKLNLDSPETGDLNEEAPKDDPIKEVTYFQWCNGYNQYRKEG